MNMIILQELFRKTRSKLHKILVNKKYGNETFRYFNNPSIKIGVYTYGIPLIKIYDPNMRLTIGKYCSIANAVTILMGGQHHIQHISTFAFQNWPNSFPAAQNNKDLKKADIVIGNDVWIGFGATIMSGVKIGNGAVIAANATVTKDVPAYAIAGGIPAKIIKMRFSKEQIDTLERIAWWDWPVDKINHQLHLLTSCHVDDFIINNS